jgi:hypothetical protein
VLYVVLLIIFLIQLLVALGALMFAVFLAHPEVPLTGDGSLGTTAKEEKHRARHWALEQSKFSIDACLLCRGGQGFLLTYHLLSPAYLFRQVGDNRYSRSEFQDCPTPSPPLFNDSMNQSLNHSMLRRPGSRTTSRWPWKRRWPQHLDGHRH